MEADGPFHPECGSDLKTDDATHIAKGHKEIYDTHNEVFERVWSEFENGLRRQGRATGLGFNGG